MPAKDIYHDSVCAALIKDGWTITDDPFTLKIGRRFVYVDLGAEKLIAAERGSEKIAIEIKSFLSPSLIRDLETAWGQFFLYSKALKKREPERCLYLAVNQSIFNSFFSEEAGQLLLEEPGFNLIVFDADCQEIIQWIKN